MNRLRFFIGASLTALLTSGASGPRTYTNPLDVRLPDGRALVTCADPTVVKAHDEAAWYAYCTSDPHTDDDRDAEGRFVFHPITVVRSTDLIHWKVVGDALPARPAWANPDSGLWAPDVTYENGHYRLYYSVDRPREGRFAIGVATSSKPGGPFVDSGQPVVEAQGDRLVIDPDVERGADGVLRLYYGSFVGGISVRTLSADGLRSDPKSEVRVVAPRRYEAANVVRRNGWYYMFASSANCCNGALSGYGVYVGRSKSPIGPFLDRDGVDMNADRAGGTPVLMMTGNRWVGPGHSFVLPDARGRDWLVYHAIDRAKAYIGGDARMTRRPLMLNPLDWKDGWPVPRGPFASATIAPALEKDDPATPASSPLPGPTAGTPLAGRSDEFGGSKLGARWRWVNSPEADSYRVTGGALQLASHYGDLGSFDAPGPALLTSPPPGDYAVETRMHFDLPMKGELLSDGAQAGLVVYGSDVRNLRLVVRAYGTARVTAFVKRDVPQDPNFPLAGDTLIGPPNDVTWLRIERRAQGGEEHYTAFTSLDGKTWRGGSTWTAKLGTSARVGVISLGGEGQTARFDYVRVYQLD